MDQFEIVDHRQLVKDCFEDFMEITVKAILKLKEQTPVESQSKNQTTSVTLQRPETGKKFTKEPVLMKDFLKSLPKENKPELNKPEKRVKLSET